MIAASLRPKLIALAIGAAVVGFTELLQIPLESLFAVILPIFGIAGHVVLHGVEAVFGPCSSLRCSCPISRPTLSFNKSAPNVPGQSDDFAD